LKKRLGGDVSPTYRDYIERALDRYYAGNGAWNLGPGLSPTGEHSVYEGALALMALLDAKSAGIEITLKGANTDQLLLLTARWLTRQYNRKYVPGGWGDGEEASTVSLALSLQVYAVLLRSELEARIPVDEDIYQDAAVHLVSYVPRELDHIRFTAVYEGVDGVPLTVQTLVTLAPNYRAIECATMWLLTARSRRQSGPQVRLVENAFDRLAVKAGPAFLQEATEAEPTFHLSLLLNALGFSRELFENAG
jgi:hypothetical protein